MLTIEEKRTQECQTMTKMIELFCHRHHHTAAGLCPECQALRDYAAERLSRCPRMAVKTFCSACPIHCYPPAQREAIRRIMRWSGPRMLLHEPLLAIRHMLLPWTTRHSR